MKNKSIWVGIVVVLALVVCANAYACFGNPNCPLGGENCPVGGFFRSVGGFVYNALPWNWGNWFGK